MQSQTNIDSRKLAELGAREKRPHGSLSARPNMCPGIAGLFGFSHQELRPEHGPFRWSIFVITARVLDALATIIRPSSLSTITVASTKMRLFPARNTSARQIRL